MMFAALACALLCPARAYAAKQSGGVSVLLIMDTSGSMNDLAPDGHGRKIDDAIKAVDRLLDGFEAISPRPEVSVMRFNGCYSTPVANDFTTNYAAVRQSLRGLRQVTSGNTPLALAIDNGGAHVCRTGAYDRSMIIILTDGGETCEGNPVETAATVFESSVNYGCGDLAPRTHVVSYTVAKDAPEYGMLQMTARAGGGQFFAAHNTAQLMSVFSAIPESILFGDLSLTRIYGGKINDLSDFSNQMTTGLQNCVRLDPGEPFAIDSLKTGCWIKKQVGIFKFSEGKVNESSRPLAKGGDAVVAFEPYLPADYVISKPLEGALTHTKYAIVNGLPVPDKKIWWTEVLACGNFNGAVQWNAIDLRRDARDRREWVHGEGGALSCRHYGYYWSTADSPAKFRFNIEEVQDTTEAPAYKPKIVGEEWELED
jgi:hypothetical protein